MAAGLGEGSTPMERIPASERTRERLKTLMDGEGEVAGGRSELVRLGGALDHRVSGARRSRGRFGARLLRPWCDTGSRLSQRLPEGAAEQRRRVVADSAPQIAERAEPFRPRIRETLRGRREELGVLRWRCMHAGC